MSSVNLNAHEILHPIGGDLQSASEQCRQRSFFPQLLSMSHRVSPQISVQDLTFCGDLSKSRYWGMSLRKILCNLYNNQNYKHFIFSSQVKSDHGLFYTFCLNIKRYMFSDISKGISLAFEHISQEDNILQFIT